MLRDLSLLFADETVPCDRTGAFTHLREMLARFGPSLVLLARHTGQVIVADPVGVETHHDEAPSLGARLAQGLRTQTACAFPFETGQGPRTAFGVRLGPDTMGALLGGLLVEDPDGGPLEALFPALAAAGNLAWMVQDERAAVERAEARKNQLRTEHETLRNAHVLALATALEEQQKRVEAEHDYSRRLEEEVRDRSEALREAVEDAQRRSAELQEYSLALESANRALEEFYHAAEAASRAKSQFLANVSHEIRTPMTAILGYADLLGDDGLSPADQAAHLDVIKRNGQHLLEIINDILDIAKIEAGKLEINKVGCSPRQLIEDVCSLLRVRADAKKIALRAEPAADLPPAVWTDPTCLRQVLINLIGNAVKFTEQGSVRVAAAMHHIEPGRGDLVIEVIDTGVGIPQGELRRIFDPFTQAEGAAGRCPGGTGLGLAICQRLTAALGGSIECDSVPGRGSTFRVCLPVQWDEHAAATQRAAPASGAAPGGQAEAKATRRLAGRVLLAEDSPDTQRLLAAILRKAGVEVTVAENGREAVETLCAGGGGPPFDAVLMDMQMPVLDGYAASAALRSRGCTLPIIALTAHALAGEHQRCLECGCTDYLTKPVDRGLLLTVLARHLPAPGNP